MLAITILFTVALVKTGRSFLWLLIVPPGLYAMSKFRMHY